MQYTHAQMTGLIQFAIEEGTGEPCSITDAEGILKSWQQAV